jgi:hypothetical protein
VVKHHSSYIDTCGLHTPVSTRRHSRITRRNRQLAQGQGTPCYRAINTVESTLNWLEYAAIFFPSTSRQVAQ